MKEIPLTQGKVALVDDGDFERFGCFRWSARKNLNTFYAVRFSTSPSGSRRCHYLHRDILGLTDSKTQGEHRNGNGLDNQSHNLRVATQSQNGRAARCRKRGTTSQFRGVSWHRGRHQKWQTMIMVDGKRLYLGHFTDEIEAAKAYDRAARHHFGEFVDPNFPEIGCCSTPRSTEAVKVVAGGGIEPPTQGFSVLKPSCSNKVPTGAMGQPV